MPQARDVNERIGELGVVPMIAIDDAAAALPLADALIAGGLPIAEITFRTAAAAEVIAALRAERPDLLVGAGTILTVENLRRASDCGAQFGVSPGLNPAVVAEARKIAFAFAPGVMTPTDVEAAMMMGLSVLKFFPAEAVGGAKTLKSLAAPYAHTVLKFIPTGGINQNNAGDYLAMDCVLAVGGSWIAGRDAIAAGDWETIERNARAARKLSK